jgi:sterol desaturase/sphingolipid hydroxylase (fatty acid hydroxylase superfamily)
MPAPDLPDVTQLAVPFFIATMLLDLVVGKVTGRARYETRDTLTSLVMGGGNLVEGMVLGFVSFAAFTWAHQFAPIKLEAQAWGWNGWVFVACFVLDDLRYYWFHRYSHEIRWFWGSHVNHHTSQHYNLSTALRQTWSYTLTVGFVFRLPLVLLGFDPLMLAFVGGVNLVYQYWIHTELIHRMPRWFEAVFNTPSHHRVHHAVNPRYLDANYAGTLIVWDKLFGTFVPERRAADPPRYGVVKQLGTFNPLRVAFHELIAIFADALQPGIPPRARLRYVFGPPGWSHDGSRETAADLKAAWVRRHPADAGQPGLPAAEGPA